MRPLPSRHFTVTSLCYLLVRQSSTVCAGAEENGLRIGGYLPDYRFYINVNQTSLQISDLVLFSLSPEPDPKGSDDGVIMPCCLHSDHLETARQARVFRKDRTGKDLAIWVTVGGAGRSSGFHRNPQALSSLIRDFAREESIDGIDLDCESFSSQPEYVKYVQWIATTANLLRQDGVLVSVALHPGQLLPAAVFEQVDRVNLMAYDMQGGDSYHAGFNKVENAVTHLIKNGCPPSKVMLGIPLYGRHKHQPGNVKTFSELFDTAHDQSKVDSAEFYSGSFEDYQFESRQSLVRKIEYATQRKLLGIFFWELGQDKQSEEHPGGWMLETTSGADTSFVNDEL